jgi:transmembrane sensor
LSNEIENIDDLLGKYLAGEATDQERVLVHSWVTQSTQNRNYFDQLKVIFDKAAEVPQTLEFDTDAAWQKVKSNLKKATPVIPIHRSSYTVWYQVAAAVLVLFVAALYFIYQSNGPAVITKEVVAEKTSVKNTLPGGTDIFLNKETKLAYAYDQATKTHEVKLKGEAYFDVKHSKREDFIVDADGVFVRDIGTSFNVKAYPGQDLVEVLVEEGEIVFFTKKDPGIHLKTGGKGVYNRKTGTFNIEAPDANITAYKTKFFVFEGTTLGAVVDELNGVYQKQIVITDKVAKCRMTVSFKNESVEEIAAVIAETLQLKLREQGDKIFLEGEGCE